MIAGKGSSFEREICVKLSKWWSKGLGLEERDDIFWRSSQSGGRATQRRKSGKDTYGSQGDITAVDPIGTPLLKMFTIELKRGRSHGSPGDLLDASPSKTIRPFEAAINQAITAHKAAGSLGWMLICRRDHKVAMVYMSSSSFKIFSEMVQLQLRHPPFVTFILFVNRLGGVSAIRFVAFTLDAFLKAVSPADMSETLTLFSYVSRTYKQS